MDQWRKGWDGMHGSMGVRVGLISIKVDLIYQSLSLEDLPINFCNCWVTELTDQNVLYLNANGGVNLMFQ